jgi:hypothetical protein
VFRQPKFEAHSCILIFVYSKVQWSWVLGANTIESMQLGSAGKKIPLLSRGPIIMFLESQIVYTKLRQLDLTRYNYGWLTDDLSDLMRFLQTINSESHAKTKSWVWEKTGFNPKTPSNKSKKKKPVCLCNVYTKSTFRSFCFLFRFDHLL